MTQTFLSVNNIHTLLTEIFHISVLVQQKLFLLSIGILGLWS